MFKEYGELSTILYELTKPTGHSVGGDIEYYYEKLKNIDAPILEAGVGTGRVLIPLVRKGLTVDGVDISSEMLAQCKINMEKHGVNANLYQKDLVDMLLPRKYGAIIMPTGSFCLLPKERARDALTSFFNHLNIGGRVIIDLELPADFKKGETISYSKPLSDDMGILLTNFSESIDWVAQKTQYIHKYELLKNGEVQKTEISNFTLYWYGISEFEMLLQSIGFAEIQYELGYGVDKQASLVTFTAVRNE